MRVVRFNFMFCVLVCAVFCSAVCNAQNGKEENSDKFVYADFETVKDNRPISNHGGMIQIFTYQENPSMTGKIKGLSGANPPAPELVRLSKDDPNRVATFEYELLASNQYAGVTLEIQGEPEKDGKPVANDLSEYKYLMVQIYEVGVSYMRVEIVSKGQGINIPVGYPQTTFKVSSGFNTYKLPLKSMAQPGWVQDKVNTKDVLKKLTSVNISVYCEGGCTPYRGTVVVDNVVFTK